MALSFYQKKKSLKATFILFIICFSKYLSMWYWSVGIHGTNLASSCLSCQKVYKSFLWPNTQFFPPEKYNLSCSPDRCNWWTDDIALLGEQEFRKSTWSEPQACVTQKCERPHCPQIPVRRVSVHWFQSGDHIYHVFTMCRAPCKVLWEDTRKGRERLTGRSLHFKNPRQIPIEPKQSQDQSLQNISQLH